MPFNQATQGLIIEKLLETLENKKTFKNGTSCEGTNVYAKPFFPNNFKI